MLLGTMVTACHEVNQYGRNAKHQRTPNVVRRRISYKVYDSARTYDLATVNDGYYTTTTQSVSLQCNARITHVAAAARDAERDCSSQELQTSSSHSLCS